MIDEINSLRHNITTTDNQEVIVIPYNQFNLTQPLDDSEVALTVRDIIAEITLIKDTNGKTLDYLIELYSKNGIKIGESENGDQFKADIDIITSLIQEQQKKLNEIGGDLSVAGASSIDNQGRIESFIELYNREIITMNKVQKEKYDKFKADYERGINDRSKDDINVRRDEKEKFDKDVESMDMTRNQENAELVRNMAEQDLGFEINKITPIEDSLFYDNNPGVVKGKAFFVIDKNGNPQITYSNDGKFQLADGFKEANKNTSRIAIMTNDDQNLEEKLIYGSIESNNGASYAFSYGDYGTPELIEIRRNPGGGTLQQERQIGRKVQTPNTKQYEINREGTSTDNITRRTFEIGRGYTSDGTKTEIAKKMNMINKDRRKDGNAEDITPEDLANDINNRIDSAYAKIEEVLVQKGEKLNVNESEEMRLYLRYRMENSDVVFDDEEVERYTEKYIENRKAQQEKKQEKEQDEDDEFEPTLYNTHKRPWM